MKKITVILISMFIFPAGLLAKPHAFPVPYVASNPSHTDIKFTDLPGPGSIKIYNIVGEEVRTLPVAAGELIKSWDLKNSSGKTVATGVYIYLIESGNSQTKGKVVVIR